MDDETIERRHKYMVLFDDGQLSGYIGDTQRVRFVDAFLEDPKRERQQHNSTMRV